MTVEEIGQATGMLSEDVITAVKSMGVVRPDTSPKKRKLSRLMRDDEPKESPKIVIYKADVWEWAKTHHLSLDDPVRDDAFVAGFPPVAASEGSDISEEED